MLSENGWQRKNPCHCGKTEWKYNVIVELSPVRVEIPSRKERWKRNKSDGKANKTYKKCLIKENCVYGARKYLIILGKNH